MRRVGAGLASLLVLSTACRGGSPGAGPTSSPTASAAPSPSHSPSPVSSGPNIDHIAVIVMENHEYGSIIGNPDAPYINALADRYGLATSYFAVAHPSLPNYLALLGGSTFGIHSDCTDCHVGAKNLIDQLEGAGRSWKAYIEGLPSPCFLGATSGRYAKKHNPVMYFDDVANDPARCRNVVPLTDLDADIAAGDVPAFVWITPDLCHDTHDCPISAGDDFLATLVPGLMRALGPDGVLFLTWDEGVTDQGCCQEPGGGHVVTIVASPLVSRGTRIDVQFTHYSLLRTIEASWDLPPLGQAGCTCTEPMTAFFAR
jgi:hypothetical protein